jgi:hypothetical protein
MRIHALALATLVACGSSTKHPVSNTGSGNPNDLVGAAMAENAKLNADYTCGCATDSPKALCNTPIVPDIREDNSMEAGGMPYLLSAPDRVKSMLGYLDTCWGKLADWEDARGMACLGQTEGTKPGPRPSCGAPPAYKLATVDEWWKQAKPCPGNQQLRTSANPMKKGALLAAWCVTIEEYDIEYAKGRITTWWVNGSVSSDRDPERRTEWYPHGQVKEDRKGAPLPPPDQYGIQPSSVIHHTHYWPNGQLSDRGDVIDGEMRGPWEGYRPDGTKDYAGTLNTYGDEPTWFDRDGKPVPEDDGGGGLAPSPSPASP